ncbi:MAG TPA: TIGR01906 family membrane protein [Coriobacteriia bacterium]|nr:TIGR01906 family membrane protein [Coriobacteriia bacterium]
MVGKSKGSNRGRATSGARRHPVAVTLTVILVVVSLLGLSFRIVLLPPVTTALAGQTVNTQLSSLSREELVAVAEVGRAYVDSVPGAEMPTGSDERTAFTPEVVRHMEDVRVVIQAAAYITIALCALLLVVLIVIGTRYGKRTLGACLAIGGIAAIATVAILGLIGVLNFNALFTAMHELLFADGTWTFAADSLLICAYPIGFWIGMATIWAISLLMLSALTSILGFVLRR